VDAEGGRGDDDHDECGDEDEGRDEDEGGDEDDGEVREEGHVEDGEGGPRRGKVENEDGRRPGCADGGRWNEGRG